MSLLRPSSRIVFMSDWKTPSCPVSHFSTASPPVEGRSLFRGDVEQRLSHGRQSSGLHLQDPVPVDPNYLKQRLVVLLERLHRFQRSNLRRNDSSTFSREVKRFAANLLMNGTIKKMPVNGRYRG